MPYEVVQPRTTGMGEIFQMLMQRKMQDKLMGRQMMMNQQRQQDTRDQRSLQMMGLLQDEIGRIDKAIADASLATDTTLLASLFEQQQATAANYAGLRDYMMNRISGGDQGMVGGMGGVPAGMGGMEAAYLRRGSGGGGGGAAGGGNARDPLADILGVSEVISATPKSSPSNSINSLISEGDVAYNDYVVPSFVPPFLRGLFETMNAPRPIREQPEIQGGYFTGGYDKNDLSYRGQVPPTPKLIKDFAAQDKQKTQKSGGRASKATQAPKKKAGSKTTSKSTTSTTKNADSGTLLEDLFRGIAQHPIFQLFG